MGFLDSITGVATIFLAVIVGLCALLVLERILRLFGAGDETDGSKFVHRSDPHYRKAS